MNIIVTGGAGFIGSNFDHIGARPCVQQRVYNPAGGNPVK